MEDEEQTHSTKREKDSNKLSIIDRMKTAVASQGTRLLEIIDDQMKGWGTRKRMVPDRTTTSNKGYSNRTPRIMAAAVILAMAANSQQIRSVSQSGPFDTDSALVGMDSRASGCITHDRADCGTLKECNRRIKGFGGVRQFRVWSTTIKWSIDDDDGRTHLFKIPNSFYIPDGDVRLFSPQHWAQTRKGVDKRGGAGEVTTAINTTLFWENGKYKRTIPIDRDGNNVATFRLSPGYKNYEKYCGEIGLDDEEKSDEPITLTDLGLTCQEASLISDDEREPELETKKDETTEWVEPDQTNNKAREFDLNGPETEEGKEVAPAVILDEEDRIEESPTAELLKIHHAYDHTPFPKLQEMAKQGVIPKKLAKCNVPVCSACQYAKATKRKWRSRTSKNWDPNRVHEPGQVVSVDQMVSSTPGLVAQMTGFLTKERYRYVTVYVDHGSGLGFSYLQKSDTAKETIESKEAFERLAKSKGVYIQHYHADNGIFKAKAWVDACKQKDQGLSFAAVGAHHTNGRAERRIRELQNMARSSLVHGSRRWPKAVTANLWPYAVQSANIAINDTPSMQDKKRRSPLQIFARTDVSSNKKHFKPIFAPAYQLKDDFRDNPKMFNKWKERSTIGIYLGQSPVHNRNVALVLNRFTGHVSPQFHVKIDDSFHTTSQMDLESLWQEKTFFKEPRKKSEKGPGAKRKRAVSEGASAASDNIGNPEGDAIPSEGADMPQEDEISRNDNAQQRHPGLPPEPEGESLQNDEADQIQARIRDRQDNERGQSRSK
jgi:transposase InsO family protein